MSCIIPGCGNVATNNVSVRLRRADTTAIWAPNTNAFICDLHANQGFTVEVNLHLREDKQLETVVSAGGQPVRRTTEIVHNP